MSMNDYRPTPIDTARRACRHENYINVILVLGLRITKS
jgi:hypothetical protein